MGFQNNEAKTTAPDQFPGSGNDLGIWTTKALQNIPVITKHGMTAEDPNSPAAFRFASEGMGEQSEPMLRTLARYGELSTTEQSGLASLLINSGIVTAKVPNDDDIYKGYRQIVEQAARHHQTVAEVLDGLQQEILKSGGAGAGGRTRAPLTITLTNPTDVHFVANKVGQSLLGRNLNDQELASITSAFQGQESSAQRKAYATGSGGGTSVAAPNAQAFAEQQVRAQNPTEAGGHDVAQTFDAFLQLIGGQVK